METFIWGLLGGALIQVPAIYKARHSACPNWAKSRFFWGVSIGMAICGGVLALVQKGGGQELASPVAFNIGLSAPLFLEQASKQTPRPVEVEE